MIIGAGFAGLIAAHVFPNHQIIESAHAPRESHKALLRFRSSVVSELTGIPFNPVMVRKGIWDGGRFVDPNIASANRYGAKVIRRISERSVWDVEPVTRYIAPTNFYERLIDYAGDRIKWGERFDYSQDMNGPIISTAPMQNVMKSVDRELPVPFERQEIHVERYIIPNCDVYQTIYYPNPSHTLYRASITGDMLICEFIGGMQGDWECAVNESFGGVFDLSELYRMDSVNQKFGKIAPINENYRKAIIRELTQKNNIFSLGRFATWRNILLDDVVKDARIIKRLITATDYERFMAATI